MLGGVRLVLAAFVLLSHLNIRIQGLNPGVIAVIVFFIISGYVSRSLLASCKGNGFAYFEDRTLRIFPAYILVLVVATITWSRFGIESHFISRPPLAVDWISNILILPLNLFKWTDQDRFTLIPQAWSLGLELQFYIVAPFIIGLARHRARLLLVLAFASWITSCFLSGDADVWGYRLLTGTLIFFIIGVLATDLRRRWLVLIYSVTIAYVFASASRLIDAPGFALEEAVGLMVGLGVVRLAGALRARKFDRYLGGLSYPFFLTHFLPIWWLQAAGFDVGAIYNEPRLFVFVFATTIGLSIALYHLVEEPIGRFRRGWRARERKPVEALVAKV